MSLTTWRDKIRFNRRREGELDRGCIANSHDVAYAWGLNDSIKWPFKPIFCVDFHDLFVVIRTLEKLNASIQRTTVGPEQKRHALDGWGEWNSMDRSSLNNLRRAHLAQRLGCGAKTSRSERCDLLEFR
eukprot:CAMPEP_0176016916 /NCGR_PEP_ID=MMETSP0120_2-20121206/8096_1 /TAXON_ID=160619 /ORGANISM="Kryptoperidinium foliaceum, Strain CCMP 1326" /LENGTH=128 /DNA_ID=CAMNT_0017349925 /DNA_START=88 /DNA_END=474 /DNA_ORIENTATION=+